MKDLLARIAIAFLLFVVALAVIGMLLPRDFEVTSKVTIDAPAEVVFAKLNDLESWREWSSWSEKITPDVEVEYGSETVGIGASQRWTDARGEGKLWITESKSPSLIEFQLEFGGFTEMFNRFSIEPSGDRAEVTWLSTGSMPSGPFYGYFGFLFESGMEAEFQKNLERLKKVAEKSAQPPKLSEPQEGVSAPSEKSPS